jgi:hypothetical protein
MEPESESKGVFFEHKNTKTHLSRPKKGVPFLVSVQGLISRWWLHIKKTHYLPAFRDFAVIYLNLPHPVVAIPTTASAIVIVVVVVVMAVAVIVVVVVAYYPSLRVIYLIVVCMSLSLVVSFLRSPPPLHFASFVDC